MTSIKSSKSVGRPATGDRYDKNGFTSEQKKWLRTEALRRGVSVHCIVRLAVDSYISRMKSVRGGKA
jgi:hypothetical protein